MQKKDRAGEMGTQSLADLCRPLSARVQPERLTWSEGRMGRASEAVTRARARGRTRLRSAKRDPDWQDPTLAAQTGETTTEPTIDASSDTTGSKGGTA